MEHVDEVIAILKSVGEWVETVSEYFLNKLDRHLSRVAVLSFG